MLDISRWNSMTILALWQYWATKKPELRQFRQSVLKRTNKNGITHLTKSFFDLISEQILNFSIIPKSKITLYLTIQKTIRTAFEVTRMGLNTSPSSYANINNGRKIKTSIKEFMESFCTFSQLRHNTVWWKDLLSALLLNESNYQPPELFRPTVTSSPHPHSQRNCTINIIIF